MGISYGFFVLNSLDERDISVGIKAELLAMGH